MAYDGYLSGCTVNLSAADGRSIQVAVTLNGSFQAAPINASAVSLAAILPAVEEQASKAGLLEVQSGCTAHAF